MAYDLPHEPSLEPPEYDTPRCPVCGAETDTLYEDKYGYAGVVGCDNCLAAIDAWDYMADHKEDYEDD